MVAEKKDMRAMDADIISFRKELFNLQLNASAGQVKDTSQFKKLRRSIARLMTERRAQAGKNA